MALDECLHSNISYLAKVLEPGLVTLETLRATDVSSDFLQFYPMLDDEGTDRAFTVVQAGKR